MTEKVAALQPQLLDVLSAESINASLELLRKQQLTRASAEARLAQLQDMLTASKLNWYRFRSGLVDFASNIQSSNNDARRLINDSLKEADLWSSISQSTLIMPAPDRIQVQNTLRFTDPSLIETLTRLVLLIGSSED